VAPNLNVRDFVSSLKSCSDFGSFIASFADGQLTDAIKHLANNSDGLVDKKVQRKTQLVLQSWHDQFKDDPSMSVIANLHKSVPRQRPQQVSTTGIGISDQEAQRRREKEEAKMKARQEKESAKERLKQEEEERRKRKNRPKRAPFNFEQVSICVICVRSILKRIVGKTQSSLQHS